MEAIFHTGVTVSNLDRSIAFYRDQLGLELAMGPTEIFCGEELSQGLGVPGACLRLAVFKIGDGSLELLEYSAPPSPVAKPMPPNTLGAMHVAFEVTDIQARVKELEARGIKFLSKPNLVADGPLKGWNWCYFLDPDGITLELVEIA